MDEQYTLYNINAVTETVPNTTTDPSERSGIHTSSGAPSPEPTSPEPDPTSVILAIELVNKM